jgi:cytochrome P450 family 307 subfamily A
MAFLGFYLLNIIVILLLVIYFNLIYKCKRGVKIIKENLHPKTSSQNQNNLETENVVLPQPPGPFPWPILGNLALLGKFESPFQAFCELSRVYGEIFTLTLGTTRCVVVNNLEMIKEVLNENGKYFGGRPNFIVSL